MRKLGFSLTRQAARWLPVLLAAAALLSACSGSAPAPASQPNPGTSANPAAKIPNLMGACTVARGGFPTPNPAESALVKPVGPGDWVKGAATARLTFIEYGDYQ